MNNSGYIRSSFNGKNTKIHSDKGQGKNFQSGLAKSVLWLVWIYKTQDTQKHFSLAKNYKINIKSL